MRGQAGAAGRRVGAWCGRPLLLAALLLGIVTMHTLGHPMGHGRAEAHASSSEALTPSSATVRTSPLGVLASSPTTAPVRHQAGGPPVQAAAGDAPAAHHARPPADPPAAVAPGGRTTPPPSHHPGLDPSSVCLAVLLGGARWAVVLLLALAVLRRPADATGAMPPALAVHALRPIPPPPRRKSLARLSVLRV
ncbi:hypothetical protein ACQEVS_09205 [Streptomyces sp. CA-181903]|uniref:hypothetical protein n=1 Tax=Streptomyces sp. CA-181903 TaxID=3240055 RepID=UPI003D9222EB